MHKKITKDQGSNNKRNFLTTLTSNNYFPRVARDSAWRSRFSGKLAGRGPARSYRTSSAASSERPRTANVINSVHLSPRYDRLRPINFVELIQRVMRNDEI